MPTGKLCRQCGDWTSEPKDGYCPDCRPAFVQRRNARPEHRARLQLPKAQRDRVYRRDRHRCIDCGSTEDLTIDHIEPLATGKRRYRDSELATRCRSCNSSKGATTRRPA